MAETGALIAAHQALSGPERRMLTRTHSALTHIHITHCPHLFQGTHTRSYTHKHTCAHTHTHTHKYAHLTCSKARRF